MRPPTLTHADTPLQTKSPRGDVWQHATDYLHPHVWKQVWLPSVWACITTRSLRERWFQHDLIAPNKRQERSGDDRERLGGAEQPPWRGRPLLMLRRLLFWKRTSWIRRGWIESREVRWREEASRRWRILQPLVLNERRLTLKIPVRWFTCFRRFNAVWKKRDPSFSWKTEGKRLPS